MIRATLYVKVKPGHADEFEAAWREIAETVRSQHGNLRQSLARDPDEPDSFIITTDWVSREVFGQFERSPEQDDLTAPLRALRESAHMTVHDLLVHVEGGETNAGSSDGPGQD
jgi:quinol monooxygenase YgiN